MEKETERKTERKTEKKYKIDRIAYSQNLLFGLFFLVAGILVFVLFSGEYKPIFSRWAATGFLIVSSFIIYRALVRRMKMRYFFIALFTFFSSLLFLVCSAKIIPYSLMQLWPLLAFFSGISLLAAGFYQKKRLSISLAVPAVLLIVLGFAFLLFSLRIVDDKFFVFASKWWPALFVIAGVTLIVIFFCRSMLNLSQFESQFEIEDDEGLHDD